MLARLWSRRYLLVAALAVVSIGLAARQASRLWAQQAMAAEHARHIAALPERKAAEYVRRLAEDDAWLGLAVEALADRRPEVAGAAAVSLHERLTSWRGLSSEESTPHVLRLASLLAARAPTLAPDSQRHAQTLAESLLLWPVDVRHASAPHLMLDCERILRLEPAEPTAEIRLATLPQVAPPVVTLLPDSPPTATAAEQSAEPLDLPPVVSAADAASSQADLYPAPPAPFADASPQPPQEPKQFLPPRGIRISDE